MKITHVSIIVPVYNTEKYLSQCITSILQQTLKEIEIILIDDGSLDKSGQICDEFKLQDERIKVFHRQNSGVSATRNFGVNESTGEYIMFVDSDDWIDSQMCEKMYHAAKKYDSDLVICGNYNVATMETTEKHLRTKETVFEGADYQHEILTTTLGLIQEKIKNPAKLDQLTPVWARLYRSSIIKKSHIKYIDLNQLPSECLQFNFEFSVFAKKAVYIDDVLYFYRRNTQMSVTKPFRANLWNKWEWWIFYMQNYIKDNCNISFIWEAYYSRICCSIIPLGGNAMKLKSLKKISTEVKTFLDKDIYQIAFKKFNYSCCPFYWKLFFYSAKNKKIYLFIFLTWCMRKILQLRKA